MCIGMFQQVPGFRGAPKSIKTLSYGTASEIYADLDWEASMGGSSGFTGLFVILFDSQWPLFAIYQVSWRLRLGPALARM